MLAPLAIQLTDDLSVELKRYFPELASYYPTAEPFLRYWCRRNLQKDWVVLDIGAHIGQYALLCSRYAGVVHAFEPTETYDWLVENLADYPWTANVHCHRVAVGAHTVAGQEETLWRLWGHQLATQRFDFITVDDFVEREQLARLDFVKIDVDGFDLDVLRGMEHTMKTLMPMIAVELSAESLRQRGQAPDDILRLMADRGYMVGYDFKMEENIVCYPTARLRRHR